MVKHFFKTFLVIAAGLTVFAPAAANADDAAEYRRLTDRWLGEYKAGKYAEAEQTARTVCRLCEDRLKQSPGQLCFAYYQQAISIHRQKRLIEAEAYYRRAISTYESNRINDGPMLAMIYEEFSDLQEDLQQPDKAEAAYRKLLVLRIKLKGADDDATLKCLGGLARVCKAQKKYKDAEAALGHVLAARERKLPLGDPEVIRSLYSLFNLHCAQEKYEAAAACVRKAIELREKTLGPDDKRVANSYHDLGWTYLKVGLLADAETAARHALAIREKALGKGHADVAESLNMVGVACKRQKRFDEAEKVYKQALAIREKAFGSEHENVLESLGNMVSLYAAAGREAETEPYYQRIVAIREKTSPKDTAAIIESLRGLLAVQKKLDHKDGAEKTLKHIIAVQQRAAGEDSGEMIEALTELGDFYREQSRRADAETAFLRVLSAWRQKQGAKSREVAQIHQLLGDLCREMKHYDDAQTHFQNALDVLLAVRGEEHEDVAACLVQMGYLNQARGRFAEAARQFEKALAMRTKLAGPDDEATVQTLFEIAGLYRQQARWAEAERLARQVLAAREKKLGAGHSEVSDVLFELGIICENQARRDDARKHYERALEIRKKAHGAESVEAAAVLSSLGDLHHLQSQLAEAERLHKQSLAILEKKLGPEHPEVANHLQNLGNDYLSQGRLAEAEALYRRGLAILEKSATPEDADISWPLANLAGLFTLQGRYAEAEPLARRALRLRETVLGPDHPDTAEALQTLGSVLEGQRLFSEAEPLFKKALAIKENAYGRDHPYVGGGVTHLVTLYQLQRRFADGEPLARRALAIFEKAYGPDHLDVAVCLHNLANLCREAGRNAEAEPLYRRAAEIREKGLAPDHPDIAEQWTDMAMMYEKTGQLGKAEKLLDQAITVLARCNAMPHTRFESYFCRARVLWQGGRKNEALADLRQALQLAEVQRTRAFGGEQERAKGFSSYSEAFDRMAIWEAELGDVSETLAAVERGRARSLLDELLVSGADLDAGRSAAERQEAGAREVALNRRMASLQQQLSDLAAQPRKPETEALAKGLQDQLAAARAELYEHFRARRNASDVYRNLLFSSAGPPRLSQIQKSVVGPGGLMLIYLLGEERSHVLVIGPEKAALAALEIPASAAKTLGVDAGPLTADRLARVLANESKTGVLQCLKTPDLPKGGMEKLAALWAVLVPAAEAKALTDGSIERLIIAPDGQLGLLPFETLVTKLAPEESFLLDAGPTVLYAPSATVLYNLQERRVAAPAATEPVLALGNPDYTLPDSKDKGKGLKMPSEVARFAAPVGQLPPLPYSGWESSWVADAFDKVGMKSVQLAGREATEANLRNRIAGRRIVHLACHGLADPAYGNFYGALALAPGKAGGDPSDDGFLTLPEIYALKLQGTELAILSACDTNYGPQQRGEGVWALSRGFLVAGARRVVASNWLVDDEAGANLMSYFCTYVADAEKKATRPDYADALRRAKLAVRRQEKWKKPYYWGSFVLVGPR